MNRLLGLSAFDQRLTFDQAASRRGLVPSSVEKDFWVCWTLQQLFGMSDLAPNLTFKGGTSLSKAWGLIDRFSEDVDLTIHREALGFGGEAGPEHAGTSTQQAKRMKALKAACRKHVEGTVMPALRERIASALDAGPWTLLGDDDDVDGQTLLFTYPSRFQLQEGRYVRPVVKIEFGARSDPWPSDTRVVRPIIAEVFPEAFPDTECALNALSPKRTFWEKAMLVHEETFRPSAKPRRPRMARHYYDLHRLIVAGVASEAARDLDLFEAVARHRQVYFGQSWVDYATLRQGGLRLHPLPGQESSWREDYEAMQGEMFSSVPPTFGEILASVHAFEAGFNESLPRPKASP